MSNSQGYKVYYDSKSHGKRRWFVDSPAKNPKDGRPVWSYEKKDGLVCDEGLAEVVKLRCFMLGYGGLKMMKVKEPVQAVQKGGL